MTTLRIGTRGSPLALFQTRWVRGKLEAAHPGLSCEIVTVRTLAEKFPERQVAEIGMGVFTRELDDAQLRGDIDLAVHSLKDVPSEIPEGIRLAAVPERESPLDAFLSPDGRPFDELQSGDRVGTGSPRRQAQILCRRPDVEVVPLRGNVATRMARMREQGLSGIVLAHAGLKRLGEDKHITHLIDPGTIVPAVSQGALGVTARDTDGGILDLLRCLEHHPSRVRVTAERGFLRRLRGGCQVPAGALATLPDPATGSGPSGPEGDALSLVGIIAAPDGSSFVRGEVRGAAEEAEDLGIRLAEEVLDRGGWSILRRLRGRK
jgi:hydroxymethylbilane synthase